MPKCIKDEAFEHFAVNRNKFETHGDQGPLHMMGISQLNLYFSLIKEEVLLRKREQFASERQCVRHQRKEENCR